MSIRVAAAQLGDLTQDLLLLYSLALKLPTLATACCACTISSWQLIIASYEHIVIIAKCPLNFLVIVRSLLQPFYNIV